MRELALHILDLIENAVTAGASRVGVEIAQETEWDMMRIVVEDNGPGLSVSAQRAMDPTISSVVAANPRLELSLCIRIDGREQVIVRSEVARQLVAPDGSAPAAHTTGGSSLNRPLAATHPLAVARQMYWKIIAGLEALQIKE